MSRALIYAGPRKAVIEEGPESDGTVAEGDVRARMVVSALSRGTERLVFEGRVPPSEHARMKAPFQRGEFPFPVEYGYCAVAEVLEGPEALLGRLIFALHPHRTLFRLPAEACVPLPDGLAPDLAALAANMETALNVVWDARIGPGDRVAVIGAGLVGCLIAHLAARLPGTSVHLADQDPSRKQTAEQLGVRFCNSSDLPVGLDVSINASASAAGLSAALGCLGVEGRCVEASWHGAAPVSVPLGEAFHANRLSLISSQVGRIPPDRAPRWTYRRRLETALALLAEAPELAALITTEVTFEDLPARLPTLLAPNAEGVATLVRYP